MSSSANRVTQLEHSDNEILPKSPTLIESWVVTRAEQPVASQILLLTSDA